MSPGEGKLEYLGEGRGYSKDFSSIMRKNKYKFSGEFIFISLFVSCLYLSFMCFFCPTVNLSLSVFVFVLCAAFFLLALILFMKRVRAYVCVCARARALRF